MTRRIRRGGAAGSAELRNVAKLMNLPVVTTATLPYAPQIPGALRYVSDGAGGKVLAHSDGIVWRQHDGALLGAGVVPPVLPVGPIPGYTGPGALSIFGAIGGATVGNSTVFSPTISGGTGPYTLSLLSGTLPPGRSISGLTVVGTYTTAGSYAYTLRVTDSLGATADLPVSVVVSAAGTALAISGTLPTGTVGSAYSFTPTVTGGSGTKAFTLTGSLPSGLSFSSSTGAISGTPGAAFNQNVSIQVTDSSGSATLGPQALIVASTGPVTDANITAFNADGWSVANSTVASAVGKSVVLNRPGFDANGNATSVAETFIQTKNVRQVFPNQASLDATRMALSDFIYAGDAITGSAVANGSALASPIPVCQFVRLDRKVVGNTIPKEFFEVSAHHRNARSGSQIAVVIWTVTDGTTTLTAKMSGMVVSNHPSDGCPVLVYRPAADLDITSLNAGQIKMDAKVYPWIGGASAVADSSLVASGARDNGSASTPSNSARGVFCSQYFLKNVAYASAPPLAYVQSGASGGTVSTSAATASAAPFPDVNTAATALKAFTGGDIGGCRIRLMAGTQVLGTNPATTHTQAVAALVIEADPSSTAANCILTQATTGLKFPYPLLYNMTVNRGANAQWGIPTGGYMQVESINYQNNSVNFGWLYANSMGKICGMTITAGTSAMLLPNTVQRHYLNRGISNRADGATITVEPTGVMGCYGFAMVVSGMSGVYGAYESGGIVFCNKFMKCTAAAIQMGDQVTDATSKAAVDCYGFVCSQNMWEYIGTTNVSLLNMGNDGRHSSTYHLIMHNNTLVGWGNNGRLNLGYDEHTKDGTQTNGRRTHTLHSIKGNSFVQLNHKDDWFYGVNLSNADGDANLRTGAWSVLYGVGMDGNLVQYGDAGGGQNGSGSSTFTPAYPGTWSAASSATMATMCGTSNTSNPIDPKFTAPAQAQSGTVAGAGDGNYQPMSGSPLYNIMTNGLFPFDLAGQMRRAANDTGGAYAMAAA